MLELDYEFLRKYLDTNSPAGFEEPVQRLFLTEAKKYIRSNDEVYIDHAGNGFVSIKADESIPNPTTIVLEAHIDEISFRIEYFKDCYAFLMENGGIDPATAPGRRVVVIKSNGELVPGVIGKTAPHLIDTKDKKTPYEIKDLFIDFGLDKEEVSKLGINPGDPVVFDCLSSKMGDYIVSKALDNKLGGFVWLEVLKRHMEKVKRSNKSPFNLIILNSVQEEIGKKGASVAAKELNPDIAFVFDVGHCTTTPHIPRQVPFSAGKGPLLVSSPITNKNLFNFLLDKIEEKLPKTSFQIRTRGKITGTDADVFTQYCPTLLMQVPLKYMHSTIEMIHEKDIRNSIRIGTMFLDELSKINSKQFKNNIYL